MEKTLDLHGVRHEQAHNMVDKFVVKHIIAKTPEVYVLTGNSKKMKEIVIHTIRDYGVTGHEDWINSGKMVIDLK